MYHLLLYQVKQHSFELDKVKLGYAGVLHVAGLGYVRLGLR